jgi:putative copper export protein/mono/diheme cytochrome c family protein
MIDAAPIMALMRGLHLAATLSLLGTAGFIAWVLPAGGRAPALLYRHLVRVWWVSGAVSVAAGLAWFTLQAAAIAGADSAAAVWAAQPVVAAHTRFGTTLMMRLALVLIATGLGMAGRGVYPTIVLAAVALGLQGIIGHAGATGGPIGNGLVLSEALHLLAAGIWLGALLPLWLSLPRLPPAGAAAVCLRFSPIGLACVLILAGTGCAQALALIGSVPALFGTPYGALALVKIGLFLLALVLAAVNRLWLTDRLAAGASRQHLVVSIGAETAIGLAIITVAAFLASAVPGVHDTPVWPLSWQFSLVTVREAPEFRQEVLASLLLIGGAVLLMAAALALRRLILPALILLLATLFWRGPSFSLLLAEAYPTSFQTSPSGFSAASITHGQALFLQNCVACHGLAGEGNGPAAAGLHIKPADLTQPHLQQHTDGDLFWFVTHGIDDPEGGLAMPGFAHALSSNDRWSLVEYVRARNAGAAIQQAAAYDAAVRAPALPIDCNGLTASTMGDLLGHAVLVAVGRAAPAVPSQDAITLLVPKEYTRPAPGSCVAADPSAWNAYAVLADLPADAAAGSAFLVDPNGWLRAVERPGAAGAWHSRDDLLAAIRVICAHPIEQPGGASHEHHP